MHSAPQRPPHRIIVGCVGNVLRGDDGFGPAVAKRLGRLPAGVEVVESGIGGVALLQELLLGCDGLIVVDAVDRGAAPGTVFAIVPDVQDYDNVPDMHLATPERVLSMAKGLGCLPASVLLVACQPVDAESLGAGLSAEVEGALEVAADQVRQVIEDWLYTGFADRPRDR
ncbi:MAG: hydrogenase maturation protease [Actinomycetota bacterium]|nr:hydrogenase maturation protease [Actinomycetota bacterium]